mgnify:CR=1 FL=1
MQYLNAANTGVNNILSQSNLLSQASANQGNIQNQNAWNQYTSMLPYNATYNAGTDYSGLGGTLGSLGGAGLGYALAPAMSLLTGPFAGMSAPLLYSLIGAGAGGLAGKTIGGAF